MPICFCRAFGKHHISSRAISYPTFPRVLSCCLSFCLVLGVLYSFRKKKVCFWILNQRLSDFCRRRCTEKCRRCTGCRRPSTEKSRSSTVSRSAGRQYTCHNLSSVKYGSKERFLSSAKYGILRQKWEITLRQAGRKATNDPVRPVASWQARSRPSHPEETDRSQASGKPGCG